MDEKTLEYMGQRVDRAREINIKIKQIKNAANKIKDKDIVLIKFGIPGHEFFLQYDFGIDFGAIKNTILNELDLHINCLEKELDEL